MIYLKEVIYGDIFNYVTNVIVVNTSINLNLKKHVSFYKLHRQAVASYHFFRAAG